MKKKIYLARENKTDRAFEGKEKRLIEISGEKFYELVTAFSGKKRYFIRLTDDIDFECAEIFAEVSQEEYTDWKKEYNRHIYIRNLRKQYEEVSFDEALLFLQNEESDEPVPEETAEVNDAFALLADAFASLDRDEKELIYLLYLCEEPLTEKQAAAALHITQQAVNKRKKKILEKMKSFWL